MRNIKLAFESERPGMFMMPRSLPEKNRLLAFASALTLFMLVFSAGISVNAQRRRRPAAPVQQPNASTAKQQTPKKNITPLHTGETSEGSRITITSDAPLNDYSAFRSGDRYYVVIPQANVARAQSGLRGRGFEDVQLQRRGDDAILSFKLQPGTNAHVNQRFNRLDVELNAPGGGSQSAKGPQTTPTPAIAAQPNPRATPQTTTGQTTTGAQVTPGTGITGQARNVPPFNPAVTGPVITTPQTAQTPTATNSPTPEAAASPNASTEAGTATGTEAGTQGSAEGSAEASPAATPSSEQIAQADQPPGAESGTASSDSSSSSTLGATLQQNWFLVLIGALVLLSLVMIAVAQRSARRRSAGAPVLRPPTRRERRGASGVKATPTLKAADTSSVVKAASSSTAVASTKPEVDVEAVAAPIVAAEAVKAVEAEEQPPTAVEEETVEVAPAVDVERVDLEVKNVLAGESYDERIVGASDVGTRQLVATVLLSALAARNLDRRERAREVFIKHGYLDEATKNLRTAEAPAERAAAARTLGYVQDKSTTPHLVAALEDEAPVARRASVEALKELRDPSAVEPLSQLLEREKDRKVPKSLIRSAIEASSAVEEETTTIEAEQPRISNADLAGLAVSGGALLAALPVAEEVDTAEEKAEAQRLAEEEARATRAREEEAARLRAEEEERARAEEAARLKAEE